MRATSVLEYETVSLLEEEDAIQIIDQTLLPGRIELIKLRTAEEIWDAIYLLKVRGAPAIGVTAAFAMYVLSKGLIFNNDDPCNHVNNFSRFKEQFCAVKEYLNSSRPTAVNLSWALNRMEKVFLACEDEQEMTMEEIKRKLRDEAVAIRNEDVSVCQRIGENGLALVNPKDGILTHCNAGKLATIKYGTATAPIYLGHERGYNFKVYADETRPLLQGARLTAFELYSAGIDVTLACDNMCASLMRAGKINAIFVGCDRVAANGDAANKIGTSVLATVAARYKVPFYVCAPTSTIDMSIESGDDILIEQRKPEEVTEMWYAERMAPEGIGVYNPAFDVTDHDLIAGIVTEFGVLRAPYRESLRKMFEDHGLL